MASKTAAHLIAEAKAQVAHVSPEELADALQRDDDVLLVDLREPAERYAYGVVSGAVHAPRGMLEFYADPTSAYFCQEFDPARRTVLYCASGGRSALAAETLTKLGYTRVAYLKGGLQAWGAAGFPIEPGA